jgi:RNA polymerase sigma factor (sigma-70 family)
MSHKEAHYRTTENYNYLYNYAIRKLNDIDLIQDLIQDTFLVALESSERFEKRSSELTWLTSILKHKIYRVYRCKSRNLINNQASVDYYTSTVQQNQCERSSHRSDEILNAKEFNKALEGFLSTLPNTWREVYDKKIGKGLKASIICEELNLTPGNYWVISHRLKYSLKKWYVENWR